MYYIISRPEKFWSAVQTAHRRGAFPVVFLRDMRDEAIAPGILLSAIK